MSETPRGRGGCATFLGVTLVLLGGVLLFSNLFGFSLLRIWTEFLLQFANYWPALLIIWGGYKLYHRASHPESPAVSAFEVFLLVFLICVGLAVGVTRRALERVSGDVGWEEVIGLVDPESRGPLHRFSDTQTFALDVSKPLVIKNTRGSITVRGTEDQEMTISLTKRVYNHSEERARTIAEQTELDLSDGSEGDPQTLSILTRAGSSESRTELETDLEIQLPITTSLQIENGRGPVRLDGLENGATVSSSYDGIEIRDIIGPVVVHSRRAPVRVERVQGNVEAFNRHGAISVNTIDGSLIAESTNASIRLSDVTGNARVKNRHARIVARRVDGDFTVEASHTAVNAENMGASLSIETTYRPVYVKDVQDGVSIDARNAEIEVRSVRGDVTVDAIYRPVVLVDIEGTTTVRARQSRLRLEKIAGPIDVESSDHPIRITNFASSVRAVGRHAPLTLLTDSLTGQLDLETTYGDVELTLPANASFSLEATIQDGDLDADFNQESWTEGQVEGVTQWSGSHGGGESPISVKTSYGDVALRRDGGQ